MHLSEFFLPIDAFFLLYNYDYGKVFLILYREVKTISQKILVHV